MVRTTVDLNRRHVGHIYDGIYQNLRTSVSKELGTALVKQQDKLFELWHRVRDGTLARCDFIELVKDIRTCIKATLEASEYEVANREKRHCKNRSYSAANCLKVESAMVICNN